jgi:hypothetical protein
VIEHGFLRHKVYYIGVVDTFLCWTRLPTAKDSVVSTSTYIFILNICCVSVIDWNLMKDYLNLSGLIWLLISTFSPLETFFLKTDKS